MARGLGKTTSARIQELLDSAAHDRRAAIAPDRATKDALERRVATGQVASPLSGLYFDANLWNELREDVGLRTTMLVRGAALLHPGWTFCHATAAHLHGLRVSYPLLGKLQVANAEGMRGNSSADVARRYVRRPERTLADGAWATSVLVTTLDVLRTQEPREGLVVADAAAAKLGLSADGLASELRRLGRGLPGIAKALSIAAYADARAESGAESMARAMMVRLRYVLPQLQVWVENPLDPSRPHRVDGMWILPDGTVVVLEVDGMQKRRDERMTQGRSEERIRWEERQRESLLSATGAKIVRLSFWDTLSELEVSRRLDLYGVPKLGSVAATAMQQPGFAMNGGVPAPGGAVIRNGWLRFERN
ncbi:hypothetical protein [uncultured Parolsenella sp.]|uniref:hypothetical protein n=1 Tax=uncultured Parolsenella sp. TaxID=2083008 RepID=UPI0027D99BCC|nr:hypothetical protein [uncultured Parolsenella sp.]